MKYLDRTLTLRVGECDGCGRWRPGAAMIEMQEIAGAHCDSVGCGREALLRKNLVWVVARMELEFLRYPTWGEELKLRTFHRPTRHRFFPRYFQVWDASGELVCQASSLWMIMDVSTRESVSVDQLPVPLPDNSDMREPMPLPRGILPLEITGKVIPYEAVYTDLDANGHVNNTKYIDWLCNALGVENMAAHPLQKATILFNHEVMPGQPLELQLRQEGLRFQMTGCREGWTAFEIGGTLMP